MVGEIPICVIGNLTDDPELRFTPSGSAVSNFTVASTPRVFDKQASEWKDGETSFLRCSVWQKQAEHVAESLRKGDWVIVSGVVRQRSFEDRDGNKRSVYEVTCDEVGPSLKWREIRHSSERPAARSSTPDPDDPWASSPQPDDPPF